jgi:hypothetical protein
MATEEKAASHGASQLRRQLPLYKGADESGPLSSKQRHDHRPAAGAGRRRPTHSSSQNPHDQRTRQSRTGTAPGTAAGTTMTMTMMETWRMPVRTRNQTTGRRQTRKRMRMSKRMMRKSKRY